MKMKINCGISAFICYIIHDKLLVYVHLYYSMYNYLSSLYLRFGHTEKKSKKQKQN